jgi:hypothetical protein
MANEGKQRPSQLIIVQHEKIEDPFFSTRWVGLCQKPFYSTASLKYSTVSIRYNIFVQFLMKDPKKI